MSYNIVKKITLDEGKIFVTTAESNVRPLYWYDSEYHGPLAEFLETVADGCIRVNRGAHTKICAISKRIKEATEYITNKGLDFLDCFHYHTGDYNKAMRYVCEVYADGILNNTIKAPYTLTSEQQEQLDTLIRDGLKHLNEVKQAEKDAGIIQIGTASRSIFEDANGEEYNLLFPQDNGNAPILAPQRDYNNGGKLKTDPSKIVHLGDDASDLYAFLSFTGVDMSVAEYIAKCPSYRDSIIAKFRRVDEAVKVAKAAGLRLKAGVEPYKGYRYGLEAAA